MGRLDVSMAVNVANRIPMVNIHTRIEKPRKGEINYLPDFPEGMDDNALEAAPRVIVSEMMKAKPDNS